MPETEAGLQDTIQAVLWKLRRGRWWILVSTLATTLGTLLVLSRIPNRYMSEATLVVTQQQVPQRYVVPTTNTDIREALEATKNDVLSRTRLLSLIEELGLFPQERKHSSPERLLEMMLRDIAINPIEGHTNASGGRDVSSFKISFIANSPQVAQVVTSKLTSLFIEQNLETREHQVTTTTNFLREQVEAAKKKVAAQEQQVRDFKMQHLGELPEQQAGNLAILSGLQGQLQNTTGSLSRAQEQKVYLESLLSGYQSLVRNLGTRRAAPDAPDARPMTPVEAAELDLKKLRSERDDLLARYTPALPEVQRLNLRISQTETLIKTLSAAEHQETKKAEGRLPSDPSPEPPANDPEAGASQALRSQIQQVKSQLESNRVEIANLTKDQTSIRAMISEYQNRINQTPVREQELAGLLRDYEQLNKDYKELLGKETESELAGNLEKRQQGQQFRLVDRPSLPTVPSSPKRLPLSLGGLGGGIALGIALAVLKSMLDTSFHSEDDLRKQFPLPIVVGVPQLSTPAEARGRVWKGVFEWALGTVMVLVVLAAEGYEYYLYRNG